MKQSLPGIKNISVLPCAGIHQHAMAKCLSDIPVGLNCNTSNLYIYPESSLEVESNYTNGDYYENLTLKFTSTTRIPKQRKMALVITDTEGHNYLIGTKERPFPVIEYTREISGSKNIYDIKVTFSGKRAVLAICRWNLLFTKYMMSLTKGLDQQVAVDRSRAESYRHFPSKNPLLSLDGSLL